MREILIEVALPVVAEIVCLGAFLAVFGLWAGVVSGAI